ncbi:dehydrogenase/reductase SDR family member on chromosome X-like [Prorops nasuta]|uniref:dehydrogenase/reductase SDR family member on chromosome X-like n=1 Tax=Prorops nasuta TaxID=863751 RepID=UPI0034CEC5A8
MMYFIIGSAIAIVAGALTLCSSNKKYKTLTRALILEAKYNLLGVIENINDFRCARINRTDLPVQSEKVAIVTGGARGIGAAVTKLLLQCDMKVIIACRKPAAGEKLIKKIRESGVKTGKAEVYQLDNSSLKSVRNFAEQIKRDHRQIHILINNAGIMFPPYKETEDGFEEQWAVNYLSHFLLTALLMPLLNATGTKEKKSRVVNVSSCAHILGTINFEDINYKDEYSTKASYAQSKLAQVLFTKILHELSLKNDLNVESYAVHPGIVSTELFENTFFHKIMFIMKFLFKTPEQGATPIVYAAINESIEDKGGMYINNCIEGYTSSLVLNENIKKKLLQLTLKQVQLKDFLQYLQ